MKVVLPFVLIANVEESGDDASFGGIVSQILDYVKSSNRTLKKEMNAEKETVAKYIEAKYKSFNASIADTNALL